MNKKLENYANQQKNVFKIFFFINFYKDYLEKKKFFSFNFKNKYKLSNTFFCYCYFFFLVTWNFKDEHKFNWIRSRYKRKRNRRT